MRRRSIPAVLICLGVLVFTGMMVARISLLEMAPAAVDYLEELQNSAIINGSSEVAHWGVMPEKYTEWGTHSNRLIPVYTFGTYGAGKGIDLRDYTGVNSLYRHADAIRRIYGFLPPRTVNPAAEYLDQTNICDIQKAALAAGKKHIILVVFDGMDWDTTRAAAIYRSRRVAYSSGRGTGLHFQDYTAAGTTQFGCMVTSPHNEGAILDVDKQTVTFPGDIQRGGYDATRGGPNPWSPNSEMPEYLIGKPKSDPESHTYTDSSSSATSMTAGIKTYNDSVNIDITGAQVATIAHLAQEEGYAVGAVTSVPVSHATPASSYAHNVYRDDYQDISRDLLGLPSISHPDKPLPGLDVLIGTGFGANVPVHKEQGANYVPGNPVLADPDLQAVDVRNGGNYVVATRQAGVKGSVALQMAANEAARTGKRLLGFYGVYGENDEHLPYRTANGDYNPSMGRKEKAESYTSEDIAENPTLAEMTRAALTVLDTNPKGFWLMVEAGDVDWANHDNNLDNSIGAVISGDVAVKTITDWVEERSNWKDTLLIVTADHGHYLHILKPKALVPPLRSRRG